MSLVNDNPSGVLKKSEMIPGLDTLVRYEGVGKCFILGKDGTGEEVLKPYTPTTLDSDIGYFELVIKMYPQGRMSHHFREMRVGDFLPVRGPKGRFKYQPGQVRAFGMLAGGSGITPMFQVARAILENPNDSTKVHLIYANVTFEDILLKVLCN
ncbi:hypothetical protein MRB53_008244 [Persea americana]|uniref:Uncharacterized protein n=1 Tax=Persea americana TaxID=3435 RepID=A0ACC2ML73_PERAE|nr:hypothetical protein MRB53_008244 [Persea americana]